MAGIANDYLIYPILDLVRDEIRKSNTTIIDGSDPFQGTPAVALYRRHPRDAERVTGAVMQYESGYRLEVILGLGSDDPSTFPLDIDQNHPEWDYYEIWRLNEVSITSFTPDDDPLTTSIISLNYDDRGLLIGTTVDRI